MDISKSIIAGMALGEMEDMNDNMKEQNNINKTYVMQYFVAFGERSPDFRKSPVIPKY